MQESIDMAELLGDLDFDPAALKAKYLEERDKRLRDDGNEQYVEVTAEFSHYVDDPYVEPGFSRAPLHDEVEVAIIGGGFGGLLMAARLREAGFDDIRMIEKAGDFGGTWYWNRYPGAMCDVESYCYLPLLEELDYMPKHKYSFAPEILQHSKRIARHYNLYENACLQTAITQLSWDAKDNRWIIETDRNDRMRARYVAMANGPLSRPKLPGIQGINDYKGHTFHTSRWDYNYTGGNSFGNLSGLKDKRVGIIGTGATAVQCIPHLGEWAKQLYVFQRTPSSIDERNNHDTDQAWAKSLEPGWQQKRMDNFNVLVSGGDQPEDLVADGWTDIMRNLTGIAAKLASRKLGRRLTKGERAELMELADYKKMNAVRARAQKIVNDEKTAELLQPWYRQFCKRPCFHDEYLDTYNRGNVTLVDTNGRGVERLTETGVVANGEHFEVDCLIFATGFEVGTSYTRRSGYDIVGRGGQTLSEHWQEGLRTFQGLTSHGFPNCFFLGFTQTAVTVNVPHALNEQAKHVAHILQAARDRGTPTVEPTAQAEEDYVQEIAKSANVGARFYAECTPGYYNSEGKRGNRSGFFSDMHSAGAIKFFKLLKDWRDEGSLEGLDLS
ncbi:MAG: NAD(P)/FAD-dependent oxidoreductase [Pseudomonadota bacterium]|nr:NAD(P)/FAD-dependent oxidoreductase [Pseudomonadota bacterium]MEC7418817.1 NAD(P)/FAD-dependent oxidoreductase [Pseudomonadota bacterium]MEC7560633.1 NAD(P)/FAD-dependent oxidoreductase [Pseudomonadota bacterium]MEC7975033.1 NAD(P)/FAD-dependent oxidoreductase [Pseudomonadota bacterium]MEC7989769.1 NAD(P)/FAD-dependent oxidoreductase [Pseudomonadota bacterium]|tara:strand:+ start:348 stop:2180 length:1833 start_codon:yes stop_codon:yes gene_type:complete